MKVLVTGGSGFVGGALRASLDGSNHSMRLALRLANAKSGIYDQVVVGQIDAATNWSAALKDVDVVIHLAARVHVMDEQSVDPLSEFRRVNVDGSLNLASQAANAGVKRLIYLSSVKVNGELTVPGQPFRESDMANPQDAYGLSKFEAEQGLLLIAQETGMEVVIIRPPLVHGQGVKANFASMMRMVKRGVPLPLGAIHNRRSFVYVGNLVSLITTCIHHPAAANQIFLVSDGCDLSTTQLFQACATALGVKSWLWPVPQGLIEGLAALVGKRDVAQRLCGNLQVDITKARSLLGWAPTISVADGLKTTAKAFSIR
ncbi:MAG: SDR family oxidoreductase [Piscirickettsiaceae bacterium]|jgi:nucleoside-diphosphate-sugar epimerase|nr:SDR family oxidoreductase [Piscirickettsiaceae bacterium]